MPYTAAGAERLLLSDLKGQAWPTWTQSVVNLVADPAGGTGSEAPSATAAGTAIPGDPRVPVPNWTTTATTALGVTSIANVGAFSFTNMPAVSSPGVTNFNVFDQAATPFRKVYGKLAANRVTVAGDTLTFADGALSVGLVTTPGTTASV